MTNARLPTDGLIVPALQSWFGIAPYPARVLWVLYGSAGNLSYGEIARRAPCKRRSVPTFISFLRAALEPDSLRPTGREHRQGNVPSYQIGLTESGRNEILNALRIMYGELGEVCYPMMERAS